MPLKEVKSGSNMYQGWITATHSHLGGECGHRCAYCYVQRNRFGVSARYQGEVRLIDSELNVKYGSGKTIFIEHMNDLFAEGVKQEWIDKIFDHCKQWPENKYVFQSKNPQRMYGYLYGLFKQKAELPFEVLVGTTIETNSCELARQASKAPSPHDRFLAMMQFKENNVPFFVTLEPIMDFDLDILTKWIIELKPNFINIGADSKRCDLPEPTKEKLELFIQKLKDNNINIEKKSNLERLLKGR